MFEEWQVRTKLIIAHDQQTGKASGTKEIIWAGNVLKRPDLYNTFYDPRVQAPDISTQGEFAGYTELYGKTNLKAMLDQLDTKLTQNFGAVFSEIASPVKNYFVPNLGTSLYTAALSREFNWFTYFGLAGSNGGNSKFGPAYEVTTVYIKICPEDFNIPAPFSKTPQVFKVILVNWSTIVHMSYADTFDGRIPAVFSYAYEDGLGNATGSLAENVSDMQQLASAFANSGIAARRRAISDRAIFNPMYLREKDVDSDDPTAKIRMTAAAAGGSVNPAYMYHQIPFMDGVSSDALSMVSAVEHMSYGISNQNQARQGQFVKGNKSRAEFNAIFDASTLRDESVAQHFENRVFAPLKEMLKYNTVQNQGAATFFAQGTKQLVTVNPGDLQSAIMGFSIADGKTPASKIADADTLQVAMQTIPAVPELAAQYNVSNVFAALLRAGGVRIDDYKYSQQEAAYNRAVSVWQQQAAEAAKAGAAFSTPMPTLQNYAASDSQQQGQGSPAQGGTQSQQQ
jgi:hypothetical protein